VARVVTRVLERKGHRITATPDGLKAWEALAAAPAAFDAVIMDLNMPGLTGIELARRAHALPYTGPLIVMSGRIGDDEQAELRECGVAAFIAKPFSIAAFEQAIADAFAHRSAK
jgi:CheY-like chemotaxis protein